MPRYTAAGLVGGVWQVSVHSHRAGWWGVAGVSTQPQGWLVGCGSTRCQYTTAGLVGGVWQY